MKKTLQDQYLLIKEGKGHTGVFLTEAKRQFPNIVRNAATFEEAAASLITKNIITENIVSLGPINSPFDSKKKESYELAFENFLAEAKKKKENEDEKVKAEEKKVSKKVEEDASHNFDNSDEKNPDNMIFDQIMMGYYAEMKDPKNADKTMQELKDMVFKNLTKDPIFYTKDGQFGVKGLGYTTEAPGLGTPKEAKGKYKASGYGDLNESIQPLNEEENKLRKVIREMINDELSTLSGEKTSLKESIDKELMAINKEAEHEIIASKLEKVQALIDKKQSQISRLDEDEDMKDLTDAKKVKEITKDIKSLEKAKAKLEKMTHKGKAKPLRKAVIDEDEIIDEISIEDDNTQESLRESVEKELVAINKEAEHEIIASKLEKVQTLIDKKQAQISRLDEDEDMKDLTDAKKVKEILKDIKALEKAKAKLEKMTHKGKANHPRKEVIDETDEIIDEAEGDLDPAEIKKAETSIKNIQTMADKIAKTELFEIDEETAGKIKELAEKAYEEYGTLEDALYEFEDKDEKEFARQHLTDAYGL